MLLSEPVKAKFTGALTRRLAMSFMVIRRERGHRKVSDIRRTKSQN